MIGPAGEQVERAGDVTEVDGSVTDTQRARDQRVVLEQVLDDPEIKRPGNRLRVLEPRLEGAIAGNMRWLVYVGEQLQLAVEFVRGLHRHESREQEVTGEDAVVGTHDGSVECKVALGRQYLHPLVD